MTFNRTGSASSILVFVRIGETLYPVIYYCTILLFSVLSPVTCSCPWPIIWNKQEIDTVTKPYYLSSKATLWAQNLVNEWSYLGFCLQFVHPKYKEAEPMTMCVGILDICSTRLYG